jgi:hypothetical protein
MTLGEQYLIGTIVFFAVTVVGVYLAKKFKWL